jgi:hypothetical protein
MFQEAGNDVYTIVAPADCAAAPQDCRFRRLPLGLCRLLRPGPERDKVLDVGPHVAAVRTGEVRDRAASDRIGRFSGRTCFGKRDRLAATGAIHHEVPSAGSSDFCLRRDSSLVIARSRIASQVRCQNIPAAGEASHRPSPIARGRRTWRLAPASLEQNLGSLSAAYSCRSRRLPFCRA